MFLLPPVPGTPVYLGAGLLLTSKAESSWATKEYLEAKEVGLYFWLAAAYAMLVALAIKLLACSLQQKLIGENMRRSVAVRKFVGINSPFMKVMRSPHISPYLPNLPISPSPFMKVMSPYLPISPKISTDLQTSPHISLTFMKVMSLLLRERGMSLAKVAILVGGPDWPTSVTVGIL